MHILGAEFEGRTWRIRHTIKTHIKLQDGMGRACGTHQGEVKCLQDLIGKPKRKRYHLGDLSVEERTEMHFTETGWKKTDWIYMDQDREKWRAFVHTVMKYQVP